MRRLSALLLVGMALVAGACGGDEVSPVQLISSAPAKTVEEKTSRMAIDVSSTGAVPIRFSGEGAFDYEAHRGRVAMDVSSLGLPAGAGGGMADVLMAGDVIYMKLPVDPAELGGRPWLKLDVDTAAQQSGLDLEGLRKQFQNNDPTTALNALRGVSNDVKAVGTEEIRGTETTHYTATVDLNKAAQQSPPEARSAVEQLGRQLGTTTFPVEVWIDGDGRLRRQRFSMDLSKVMAPGARPGGLTGVMTTTVELFDFGTEVDVKEPPADQVTDFMTVLQQAPRG